MATVSIVMPTYNQRQYIPIAVESVLAQSFRDFELIVINDGSTDGTREYIESIRDPRVRAISQPNRGAATAINHGVSLATGEYLSWISSDDAIAPYFLEAFLKGFERVPELDYIYSSYYTIDDTGRVTGIVDDNRPNYRGLVFNRNPGCISFLYRRKIHEVVGTYNETIRISYDTEMWARIFRHHRIGRVIEPLHYYRYHSEQSTGLGIREGIIDQESQRMLNEYWVKTMGSSITRAVHDLFPGLERASGGKSLFCCVWSLAADFYHFMAFETAAEILLYALTMAPAEHITEVLVFLANCTHGEGDTGTRLAARAADALRSNPDAEACQFAALIQPLFAARRKASAVSVLMLPSQTVARALERPDAVKLSFRQDETGQAFLLAGGAPA